MDLVTLAMAKAYSDSQRLAYVEGDMNTLTFDGDETGKALISGEMMGQPGNFVRIADAIDTSKIESFTTKVVSELNELIDTTTYQKDQMNFMEEAGLMYGVSVLFGNLERIAIIVFPQDSDTGAGGILLAGTYVWEDSDSTATAYISSVTYNDTVVHPIDPKFIPAVDALILNANGTQYRIAVDETGTLTTTEVV